MEKVATNEAHEAKKLAKLAVIAKLGSTKKLPKMPKGEREDTLGPFKPRNGEGRALTKKGIFQKGSLQGHHPSGGIGLIFFQLLGFE